jgi:hypothetical protein
MLATMQFRIFCLPNCYLGNLTIKIHKTIILPVVLYGYDILSLKLTLYVPDFRRIIFYYHYFMGMEDHHEGREAPAI